jgi:uridine phosphorylase
MIKKPPLLSNKLYRQQALFTPENLLREARRQKKTPKKTAPRICVLDPDGDLVRYLRKTDQAKLSKGWACYHTELYEFEVGGMHLGVVGCAVGAPFAVLVAEEMFASGCKLVVSVTSAGQILSVRPPPYFVLVTRALRDEGTSYHYLPASDYTEIQPKMLSFARRALSTIEPSVEEGAVWTTDAPFRETKQAIAAAKKERLLAVEMESAALYALAVAKRKSILCFAHVTNCMAQTKGDFEKGEADGSVAVLGLLRCIAEEWAPSLT